MNRLDIMYLEKIAFYTSNMFTIYLLEDIYN